MGTIVENNINRSVDKRDWTTTQWIGLGLAALCQTGVTISGVIPYCRSNHKPEWTNTWQCVTSGISILLGFDSYLIGRGGNSGGVKRIDSVGHRLESKKGEISSNINMYGRQNWLDIVGLARAKGYTPLHIMYDRADLYSDGSVIVTNPIVTYGLDNSPIMNYINNGDGFILSTEDSTCLNDNKTEIGSTSSNSIITFSKGGLISQFDHCGILSEIISLQTDIHKVNDYLNSYWHYNSGHRHNWIIRDSDYLIAEVLLQMYWSVKGENE